MKICFTGSRNGLTPDQRISVRLMLATAATKPGPHEFHHGDCIGADAEAHEIATKNGFRTVAHPSDIPSMRAHTKADEIRPVKPPIERNHDIVDETNVLIACPATQHEVIRSGTWATVRYWRRTARHHMRCILPDGTVLTR